MLRSRLTDKAGDRRAEVRVPCGRILDDEEILATPKGGIAGHYLSGGELYNCSIEGDAASSYQIVFEDIPSDYDSSFDVEVLAVSARYPGK